MAGNAANFDHPVSVQHMAGRLAAQCASNSSMLNERRSTHNSTVTPGNFPCLTWSCTSARRPGCRFRRQPGQVCGRYMCREASPGVCRRWAPHVTEVPQPVSFSHGARITCESSVRTLNSRRSMRLTTSASGSWMNASVRVHASRTCSSGQARPCKERSSCRSTWHDNSAVHP